MRYTHNLYEDVTYRISGNESGWRWAATWWSPAPASQTHLTPKGGRRGAVPNEYGMRMRQGPIYVEVVDYPLSQAQTAADVAAYAFPDPIRPGAFPRRPSSTSASTRTIT